MKKITRAGTVYVISAVMLISGGMMSVSHADAAADTEYQFDHEKCPVPMPIGMHFIGKFAGSKTASFRIEKGRTEFKVNASKKKTSVSALRKKSRTVKLKVSDLTQGSSKPAFTLKKVTNGQKSKVKVNSKTGKVRIRKNTKKCTIYIKALSKANHNRAAAERTIRLVVR